MIKISGCTIIKQPNTLCYPLLEAILVVLPIVDEYIVMVDDTQGDTINLLEKIKEKYPKLRYVNRQWPLANGPIVLSEVTNWAFEECKGDWIIHNQADEVYNENAIEKIYDRIQKNDCDAILVNRYQVAHNFQGPHCGGSCTMVRIGRKGVINSVGDALCIDSPPESSVHLQPNEDVIHLWDVTRNFPNSFPGKSAGQADVWWFLPNRNSGAWYDLTPEQWEKQIAKWKEEGYPEIYTRKTSPYMDRLPNILKEFVGVPEYRIRWELLE